ncbi:MAG TPA: hypothetical protein VFY68_15020 [Nitrososphaeraceae archaeon]|nr:hypothetical protein [Nitrososphaeraceae archaeon]
MSNKQKLEQKLGEALGLEMAAQKRYGGMGRMKDILDSLSSSMSGNNQEPPKYYCMGCGKEHREITCPYCCSKMKSVG